MNLDELTLGDIKQISALFNLGSATLSRDKNITSSAIGKYVIVRSRNEGINAGYLEDADETGCVLKDAQRIWYHKPADASVAWYEGVANTGLSDQSKISCKVHKKIIIEDYSVTECTEIARLSITGLKPHESK